MNVILSLDKYTNNNMKVKWSNYELAKSYDEYISSENKVRRHIKKIGNFFESLSLNDLKELDSSTESAIKSMGINFRVLGIFDNISSNVKSPLQEPTLI